MISSRTGRPVPAAAGASTRVIACSTPGRSAITRALRFCPTFSVVFPSRLELFLRAMHQEWSRQVSLAHAGTPEEFSS